MSWFNLVLIIFLYVLLYGAARCIISLERMIDKVKAELSALDHKNGESLNFLAKYCGDLDNEEKKLYQTHMKDLNAAYLNMNNISNELNRTKIRVGKLEQNIGAFNLEDLAKDPLADVNVADLLFPENINEEL